MTHTMMPRVLLLYSTVDGHTRSICERVAETLEAEGVETTIRELTPAASPDLSACDGVVIGASVRYGKHRPEVASFVDRHRHTLESMPSAFFSVNAVARKDGKRTPESNPYVRKFLGSIDWKPAHIGIFAGRIDYPRYRFVDRHLIRLIMWITGGPTDLAGSYEFTDWAAVETFGRGIASLVEPTNGR